MDLQLDCLALANRRALRQKMTHLLEGREARDAPVLIAFVDLDGFKAINDMHGHDLGDRFLVELAARLRSILRAGDMAARIGGDEFVVVGACPDQLDADRLAAARQTFQERIFQATAGEYQLGDVRLDYAGASVGVLDVRPSTHDAAQALKQADALMYAVKKERRAAAAGRAR